MSDTVTGPADEFTELSSLIAERGGRVTAEQVVEHAKNPASTFHKHFLWDDTEAAHRYRLQQAGALIRKFKVNRRQGNDIIRVDAFVKIPDSTDGYAPVEDAVQLDWVVEQKRIKLMSQLRRIGEELRHWEEFTGIAVAIDEALAVTQ